MKELTAKDLIEVKGGFHIKLHVNLFQAVFTVIGAGILSGPVGAGVAIGAIIGAQGAGNLYEMYLDEYGNKRNQ